MVERHIIPPPMPDEVLRAQFEALRDPSSGREAVLVVPGERVPDVDLDDLYRVNVLPFGILYTGDRGLARRLKAWAEFGDLRRGDSVLGRALFQAAGAKGAPPDADTQVIAYNKDGVMVSEVVVNGQDVYALSVAEAVMRSHAGPDGSTKVKVLKDSMDWIEYLRWYRERGGGVPYTLRDVLRVPD